MCGIIGLLGNNESDDLTRTILNGLYMLQNRGYDSVGVALIESEQLSIVKKASDDTNNSLKIVSDIVMNKSCRSDVGIGHTRWATHGGKTDINAHPHCDNNMKIAIVHNGIIDNYQELKVFLENNGYKFHSQTDTEVIVNLISYYAKTMSMSDAINSTISDMSGTWALAIINSDYPNKMWLTRNGSPLLLSCNETFAMICSEQSGFCNYVLQYYPIDNHDVIEISYVNGKIINNKIVHEDKIIRKEFLDVQLSPAPYTHWMEKEIFSQPSNIKNAYNNGGRISSNSTVKLGGLELHKEQLLLAEHMIILGCGTSFNAGLWASHMFKEMRLFKSVLVVDGAEFCKYDIPMGKTVFVLLSQSGETRDLIRCLPLLGDNISIGIVNVTDSEISRQTTCGVYLNAGREIAVASTKSFTNQCVVLSLVSVWFAQHKEMCHTIRERIINDVRLLPIHIENVLNNSNKLDKIVPLMTNNSCFVLGKGSSQAIATECALKLKEIAYIHAEGYSSSALKHGPFALIQKNIPIFIINTNPEFHDSNMSAYHETKARHANTILIGGNQYLDVDYNKTFGDVIANVYIQLLSYKIAIIREINPDFPRNLAKVVTVS